jgi:flagellar biosynthetic protein FlhB
MTHYLGNSSAYPETPDGAYSLLVRVAVDFLRIVTPLLAGVALTGIVANVGQVGLMFSSHLLKPDYSRMDPMKGVARMFSGRSMVELLKSLAKLAVMGWVAWAFLKGERDTIVSLGLMDHAQAGQHVRDLIWRLCLRMSLVMMVIAGADYLYQRFQFEKSIKMTRQEVKEEMKRSEGDPIIKSQFKRRHRQLAMKRMMQDVPTADVIVTNPTHYAVALKYEAKSMSAPVVVAKGADFVAQRIKEIAKEHHIPTVENKPVARSLFAAAEVGQAIPVELYHAVAEILAFVYRLRHGVGRGR